MRRRTRDFLENVNVNIPVKSNRLRLLCSRPTKAEIVSQGLPCLGGSHLFFVFREALPTCWETDFASC
jgi:hypothetical protein